MLLPTIFNAMRGVNLRERWGSGSVSLPQFQKVVHGTDAVRQTDPMPVAGELDPVGHPVRYRYARAAKIVKTQICVTEHSIALIHFRFYFGFMNLEFDDDDLDRLETDPRFTGKYHQDIVKRYRKLIQAIRSAEDERDLYASRSFHFEKLKGNRKGQHFLKIDDQWRLIVILGGKGATKVVRVIEIVDYH